MLRSALTPSAPELFDADAFNSSTGESSPTDTRRYVAGATSVLETIYSNNEIASPIVWLQIVRYGNSVTAYYAPDVNGAPGTWVYRTAQTFNNLPTTVYIGLASSSRSSAINTATFDNVSVATLSRAAETSWLANTYGGGNYHVMDNAETAYVDQSGELYLDGGDESDGMSIYNPNASLLGFGSASGTYEDGSAITADSTFIYDAQVEHYDYDSDGIQLYDHYGMAIMQNNSSNQIAVMGDDVVTGLATANGYLYAASNNLIYKFSTSTNASPSLVGMWEVDSGGNMAVDQSGNLWIVQSAHGSNSADVVHETPAGASAGSSIMFPSATFAGQTVIPKGIAVDLRTGATTGQVYVTDTGQLQDVHIFNSAGAYVRDFGVQFGAYGASANGAVTASTLIMPVGVGIDSSGDVYVVGDAPGGGQNAGTIVKKFNSLGTLQWELDGLNYITVAAPDPANPTSVYSDMYHFLLNYNATIPGTEATLVGVLYDPFLTTSGAPTGADDPRVVGSSIVTPAEAGEGSESSRDGVVIREISGTTFLYDFDQHASAVNVYRFLPNSQITVFCAELVRQTDRYNSADDAFYIWTDGNGDGIKQASEEQIVIGDYEGGGARESVNWYVDANGNIWTADCDSTDPYDSSKYNSTGGMIREYLVQGINSAGAPIYLDDTNQSHVARWAAPSIFTEISRAIYNTTTDTLVLSGYTTTYPRGSTDIDTGTTGPEMLSYANWLPDTAKPSGNNGVSAMSSWAVALPYTPETTGSDLARPNTMTAIDVSGNYVFVANGTIAYGVNVYQATAGALVLNIPGGPEIAAGNGLLDFRNGMNATELSNGQYEIMVEEDSEGKTILYRWTPGVTLPAEGWYDGDVGSPAAAGSGSFSDTIYGQPATWTLTGAGTGLAGTSDQFNFSSTNFTVNGSITADVASITTTSGQAGIMIRDSTSAASLFAAVMVTPTGSVVFQDRTAAGASTSSVTVAAGTNPKLVRISRVGNVYTASYSTNGTSFTQIGSPLTINFTSVANGTPSLAGLAVTSQSAATLATATFNSVVIDNPTIGTAIAAGINPVPGNSTTLSVVGADPSGTSTLTYAWATDRRASCCRCLLCQRHERGAKHDRHFHQGR